MYTYTCSSKFSLKPSEISSPWLPLVTLIFVASLFGCDIYTAETHSADARHDKHATERPERDHAIHRTGNSTVAFKELTVTSLSKTTLSETTDGKLIVAPTSPGLFGISVDITHLDSTHVYFEPIHLPHRSTFQNTLYGRIDGIPTKLPGLALETEFNGASMISASFDDVFDRIKGDTVFVRFLYKGVVQYETARPVEPRLPIAFYNTEPSSRKSATTSEEPTSSYWAYLEGGTWVLMYDWTEQPEKNDIAGPITLTPAFPTPFAEIPVDFIRLEFSYEAEHVTAERMELTATNAGFTLTNAE